MGKVRLREPVAIYDAELGAHVVPKPTDYYDEKDPLVKAHPWAFASDEELSAQPMGIMESVQIEQATAEPGEKRSTRK